jgi:hypothetical protein
MPLEAYGFGVSPDWPRDPFLIARLRSQYDSDGRRWVPPVPPAVRTFDGGHTWEPLPAAPPSSRLHIQRNGQGRRVILSLPDPLGSQRGERNGPLPVSRSTDDGLTWQEVHHVEGENAPTLTASPTFSQDGHAYLLNGVRLFETRDTGLTWTQRELVADQWIRDLVFSPVHATDQTIFAASETILPREASATGATEPSGDLLVSTDAGESWSTVAEGLQIDGVPHRQVKTIAVSPDFAQDRTLFAFAWGPLERFGDGSLRWQHSALFRSQDAGASWVVIWRPEYRPQPLPGSYIPYFGMTILPSPSYAGNGTVAIAARSSGGSPSSGGCSLLFSSDGGTTWTGKTTFGPPSCVGPVFLPKHPATVIFGDYSGYSATRNVFAVTEYARTIVRPPADWSPPLELRGPVVAADGSAFFGTEYGLWMLPPDVPAVTVSP